MEEQQLGQTRPADTNNHSIYSPSAGETTVVSTIIICNTSGSAVTYRIFVDDDGSTYDQDTALFYGISLDANTTDILQTHIGMDDSNGNLAVRSSSANALTFTVHGSVI